MWLNDGKAPATLGYDDWRLPGDNEGAHPDECDTTNTMTRSILTGGDHNDDDDALSGGVVRLDATMVN